MGIQEKEKGNPEQQLVDECYISIQYKMRFLVVVANISNVLFQASQLFSNKSKNIKMVNQIYSIGSFVIFVLLGLSSRY